MTILNIRFNKSVRIGTDEVTFLTNEKAIIEYCSNFTQLTDLKTKAKVLVPNSNIAYMSFEDSVIESKPKKQKNDKKT